MQGKQPDRVSADGVEPAPPPPAALPAVHPTLAQALTPPANSDGATPPGLGAESSDAELVQAIAQKQRDALAALYDRHAPRLLELAQKLMNNPLDAEDLLHDLFLEVWHRAYQYAPQRGTVTTWLVLRLRSRAIDRMRAASYRRVVAIDEENTSASESASGFGVPVTEEFADRTQEGSLARAVAALPDETQTILKLVYFRGLSLREVAAQLLLPLGTVKSRLHRALRSLRSSVSSPADEGEESAE